MKPKNGKRPVRRLAERISLSYRASIYIIYNTEYIIYIKLVVFSSLVPNQHDGCSHGRRFRASGLASPGVGPTGSPGFRSEGLSLAEVRLPVEAVPQGELTPVKRCNCVDRNDHVVRC